MATSKPSATPRAKAPTIKKKDLIDRIAVETGQKRVVVKRTIQAFLDMVVAEIANGNRLEFRDFGVFEVKARAARSAQNPKTLQRVNVPARRTVRFKVGRVMREYLDGVARPAVAGTIGPATNADNGKPESPEVQVKVRTKRDAAAGRP